MVRVVVTAPADADAGEIPAKIAREAGYFVAVKFNSRFESLYDRLGDHPYSSTLSGRNWGLIYASDSFFPTS